MFILFNCSLAVCAGSEFGRPLFLTHAVYAAVSVFVLDKDVFIMYIVCHTNYILFKISILLFYEVYCMYLMNL